jgi:outer membrane receptor protein involved in Fe transport
MAQEMKGPGGVRAALLLAAAPIALAMFSQPAAAQAAADTSAPQEDAAQDELQVADILVTARKREESLQSAPLAVSAFTAQDIFERGLRDISDIALFTPGFSQQNIQAGTEQPFIRGQSSTSFERNLQTSSSFVDGNYFSVLGRTVFFADLDRVEIVRGPQAALFGRATFAGAINYVTKNPTEDYGGEVRLAAGSFGRVLAHGSVSGAIIPGKLQFRVSANSELFGGQYENRPTDQKTGEMRHHGVTGALRFLPTETLTIDLKGFKTWYRDEAQVPEYIQGANTLNCFPNAVGVPTYFCGQLNPDPSQVSMNLNLVDNGRQHLDQDRALLNVDWEVGDWTVTSVSTYARQFSKTFCDCDYSNKVPLAGAFHSDFWTSIENKSTELRIRTPQSNWARLLVGGYLFREDSNSFRANAASIVTPFVTVDTKAVFASLELDLGKRITLSLDGRYQTERQTRTAIPGNPAIDVEYDAVLPRAIIEWRPQEGFMFYASAAEGNQPGQFNIGTNIPAALVRIDSEQLWSYEIGAKTSFFDNRLRLNVAAYHIDWSNQVYRAEAVGTDGRIINVLQNLGGSRVNGIEFEAATVLARGWTANATFAYTDSKYVNFLSPNTLRVYGRAQAAGQRLPNTPQYQGSFVTQYQRSAFDGIDWFIRGDYAYRGRQFVSEVNQAYIGALHLLNAATGLEDGNLRIALRVENLLDSDVPEFATRFSDLNSPGLSRFGYLLKLRTGRTFEVSAQFRF